MMFYRKLVTLITNFGEDGDFIAESDCALTSRAHAGKRRRHNCRRRQTTLTSHAEIVNRDPQTLHT